MRECRSRHPMKYFLYCRKSTESEDRQVLSIDSQRAELIATFGKQAGIQIVDSYQESYSAKAPGRPLFSEMLERIERGEAEGIIAWHPDRLARNSIDGGRIIFLLDGKKLQDLKFATFSFENNPQGKFMLSIIFGYSKYYVDSLSENVKRGNRAKLQRGWRPNQAPLGYLNDPATKTILPDPDRFDLVRRIFDYALTERYSTRQIAIATRDWGLKTPKRKRMGGKYLSASNVFYILRNSFYAGILTWDNETYKGAHRPLITVEEFEAVQKHLGDRTKPVPKKREFEFTGLIRCGECGLMVTAETKTKPSGRQYHYYHCTKKRLDYRCGQGSITAAELDATFLAFVAEHTITKESADWMLSCIAEARAKDDRTDEVQKKALQSALADTQRALQTLTSLRIRELIDDDELASQRVKLLDEQHRIEARLTSLDGQAEQWFEPAEAVVSFSSRAIFLYKDGDTQQRRHIIKTLGSNLVLMDKKLSIQAAKPFHLLSKNADRSSLLAVLSAIRTQYAQLDQNFMEVAREIRKVDEHANDNPGSNQRKGQKKYRIGTCDEKQTRAGTSAG